MTRIDEAFFADDSEFALPEPNPAEEGAGEREFDSSDERVG